MSHILENPAIYNAMVISNDESRGVGRYFELIRLTIPLFRDAIAELPESARNDVKYVDVPYYGRNVKGVVVYEREGLALKGVWHSHYDFIVIVDSTVPASQAVYARIIVRGDKVDFQPSGPAEWQELPLDWVSSLWGGMVVTGGKAFESLMMPSRFDPAGTLRKYREQHATSRR